MTGPRSWPRRVAALCVALAVCLPPAVLAGLSEDGYFLAPWKERALGWNSAGRLILAHRRLRLERDGAVLWETSPDWKVEDALLGDVDGDGAQELMVLLWRRGSFGRERPFWVTGEERSWSQHIFLYRWEAGSVTPFWMSSALRPQVKDWSVEPEGAVRIVTEHGEDTRWRWRTWGLERVDKAPVPI